MQPEKSGRLASQEWKLVELIDGNLSGKVSQMSHISWWFIVLKFMGKDISEFITSRVCALMRLQK